MSLSFLELMLPPPGRRQQMVLSLLHWLLLPPAPAISAQWAGTTCLGIMAWQPPFHMEQMAQEACCELAC